MKLPRFSGKPKKPKVCILVRRVAGSSMLPAFQPGQLILAVGLDQLKLADVVVFTHDGLEKIKRVSRLENDRVFVVGDNPDGSTDSRDFGWIPRSAIRAKVVWPRSRLKLRFFGL